MGKNFFRTKPPALSGEPVIRREKFYAAQSGYVFSYFYEGCRGSGGGAEYVFQVSSDRKHTLLLSVFLNPDSIAAWQQAHGRSLASNERYAIAKMALFAAFDECPGPAGLREPVVVSAADIDRIMDTLGLN